MVNDFFRFVKFRKENERIIGRYYYICLDKYRNMKGLRSITIFPGVLFLVFVFSVNLQGQEKDKLVSLCVQESGEDAAYLKDYVVKLPKATSKDKVPVAKHTLVLVKNTHYRFTICNSEKYPGKGIIKLYDTKGVIASNFDSKKNKLYNSIDFICKKTGPYTVFISFKDGEQGMAVSILSYVKK